MKHLLMLSLLAALALLPGCHSSSSSGGGEKDTGTDADSDADTDSDGDTDTDVDTDVYPICEERDGVCEPIADTAASCPADTYNPFSGDLAFCPGDSLALCCVPEGGYGSPCQGEDGCDDGVGCLPESSGYPAGGLCTAACDPESQGEPAWMICLPTFFSAAPGVVMLTCDRDELCRESWSCQSFPLQPFDSPGETTNVCWQTGIGMSMNGLGEPCAVDTDCLSQYCLQDADDDQVKCTATCDDAHPCLPGYACDQVVDCSTPGCGVCFPD